MRGLPLFNVPGYGFLGIDTRGLPATVNLSGTVRMTFAIPAGLTLADDPVERFTQLATHAATVDTARSLIASSPAKQIRRAWRVPINQTPAASAVHQVYAVLVSPNNSPRHSNRTLPKPAAAVAHAQSLLDVPVALGCHHRVQPGRDYYLVRSAVQLHDQCGLHGLCGTRRAPIAASQLGDVAGKTPTSFRSSRTTRTAAARLGFVGRRIASTPAASSCRGRQHPADPQGHPGDEPVTTFAR